MDERKPGDGHVVLAGYFGPSAAPSMESLQYHASDEHGRSDRWYNAFDSEADAPTHWMPLPKGPK